MATLLSIPLLGVLVMVQTGIISRLHLLQGTADVILLALIAWALQERVKTSWWWTLVGGLMMSLITALPLFIPLIGYLIVTGLVRLFQRRVWQTPILVMFLCSFIGTLITQGLALVALRFQGTSLPIAQSLNLITLPSALLNLILAIPIYALIHDVALWVYPEEVDV